MPLQPLVNLMQYATALRALFWQLQQIDLILRYMPTPWPKKILFSGTTATGVVMQSNGTISTLRANKEVILSAGALQSPQILMVSGIGPESTLRRHNIPCIVNRPGVGQGMQDHIFFGPSYRVNVQTFSRRANVR